MAQMITDNKGMALVVTMGIIVVIMAVVLEYGRKAVDTAVLTKTMRDKITAKHMAESGIHAACALLVKDMKENVTDALYEDWADHEVLKALVREIPFDEGELTLTIIDERGKIQVNALIQYPGNQYNETQKAVWDRMLRFFSGEDDSGKAGDSTAIIESLKDWLDDNDDDAVTGLNGAESSYYEKLDHPYPCRNGPILEADEIFKVKGVKRSLFAKMHLLDLLTPYLDKTPDYMKDSDITQYISAFGMTDVNDVMTYNGKININTAPLPVLAALAPSENPDLAVILYRFRNDFLETATKTQWWLELPGGDAVSEDLVTTKSDCFRIIAEAKVRGKKHGETAVVRRNITDESGIPAISIIMNRSN